MTWYWMLFGALSQFALSPTNSPLGVGLTCKLSHAGEVAKRRDRAPGPSRHISHDSYYGAPYARHYCVALGSLLNVLREYASGPTLRAPCIDRHLTRLATKSCEISGLTCARNTRPDTWDKTPRAAAGQRIALFLASQCCILSFMKPFTFGCTFVALWIATGNFLADDWPQWLGPQRDGVWRETGIVQELPKNGPRIRWRTPIGSGYTGPAVAGERVVVLDRQLAERASNPNNPFSRASIPGSERVLCLHAKTGDILWRHEYPCSYTVSYPSGPRATPVISDGKVFTLGAEGDLLALNLDSGKVLWSRNFPRDFSIKTPLWGFSAHPLLFEDKLICMVGGEGSTAVAFDRETGKEIWRALSAKEPGYCPPTLIEAGGVTQLIIWHPESINSLNPATGEVYWSHPWQLRSGLAIPTPRQLGDHLFFTAFYNGSRMFRLHQNQPGGSLLWQTKKASEKDTTHLNSIMSTPFLEAGHIYGICSHGQLRCLRVDDGLRVWDTMAATTGGSPERWANAFIVKQEDRFFLFNERGDLIIARLTPSGYAEVSRMHLLEPNGKDLRRRPVVWSHPAFAHRSIYARNDTEIVCASLAQDPLVR